MNVFELKQERASVTASIRELMDKYDGKEMDAVDKETLGNLEAKFDSLNESITNEEKQIEREKLIAESKAPKTDAKDERRMLFTNALKGDRESIERYRNDVNYTLGTDATAGALTAPMEFRDELIKGLDDILFMRQIARNIGSIGNAQTLGFPYRKTAASDAEWVAEVAAAPEEQTLEYGRREFKPLRMAKLMKLSRTLINHSPNADGIIRDEMLYRIAITMEKAYMTGDGDGKPLGIFTASNSGISTGRDIAGAVDNADTFIDMKYSLKEQYMGKAEWVMHRDLVKNIAKLKDEVGQYLWQPSLIDGQPDRFLGLPVHMSEYAPNTMTANSYVAVLGDFNYYWIVDADALTVQILNELYAVNNQIGYLFNYFGDGAPVLDEAFARLKVGASA